MKKNTKKTRKSKKEKKKIKGLTLISLVITVIALVALAGVLVSISSGLFYKIVETKEAARGSSVREKLFFEMTLNMEEQAAEGRPKPRQQVIDELHNEGLLKDDEVAILQENNIVVIGGVTVDFGCLGDI